MCRVPFTPEMRDIFEHGMYDMIKEKRASQAALATDIHAMLQDTERGTLLAEGGTGIGKSFAYLIPSLIREDKRIVIATAKKTLQDQLFTKDVPYVCDSMCSDKTYTIYKGKSNYACWLLASEIYDALDKKHYLEFINDARVWGRPADIKDWKGGRPMWWPKVDISNCIMGKNCPHILQCKPQPQQSNIVITNHHLLAIDLKLGPGFLLGDYNMLIVDEGHQAPEAFRAAYTHKLTAKGLDGLRTMVVNDENLRALVDDSGVVSSKIFVAHVKMLVSQYKEYHEELRPYTNAVGQVDIVEGRKRILKFTETAREMNRSLEMLYKTTQTMLQHSSSSYSEDYTAIETFSRDQLRSLTRKIKRVVSRVGSIMEFVSRLHDSEHTDGSGNYLLTRQPEGMKIEPIQVGPLVRKALRRAQHKVIVSATLAMGKDFSHTEESYGLTPVEPDDNVLTKIYPTAFNLKKQAVLYAPRMTPDGEVFPIPARREQPGREEWVEAVSHEVVRLTTATQGDAFVLFSARADMEDVVAETEDALEAEGLSLIVQEGEASTVQDTYIKTDKCVLYGLKSFWEGVDIQGDKLKIVIIPKLPFPNPTDPLIKALSEKAEKEGKRPFVEVMVPKMVADMRQGVGRLIRSQSDRGFIAILDSRIWSSSSNPETHKDKIAEIIAHPNKKRWGYGKNLLDALGYRSITDSFTTVERWVNKFFNTP